MLKRKGFGHGVINRGKNPLFSGMISAFDIFGTEKGFNINAFRMNALVRRLRNSLSNDFRTTAHYMNAALDQYHDQNEED